MKRLAAALALLLASSSAFALETGQRAPDFSGVKLQDGKTLKLSSLRGKVVYLDFWASWCAPCRVSLPMLDELHQDLAAQGFSVIGVNVDENIEDARRVLQRHALAYPVVRDIGEKTLLAYDIQDMPYAYLLDRQGRVQAVHRGFRASEFPALRTQIEALLKEKKK